MAIKQTLPITLLVLASASSAQSPPMVVHPSIRLPTHRATAESLTTSLEQFLGSLALDAEENQWVDPAQTLATAVLLDEMRGMPIEGGPAEGEQVEGAQVEGTPAKESAAERRTYRPHLTNVVPLAAKQYFVQLSYVGLEDGIPAIRSTFELIARPSERGFRFASPLARNTRNWKTLRVENTTFHYADTIDEAKAKAYHRLAASFDKRLKSTPKESVFYFFDSDLDAHHALGMPYNRAYNGQGGSVRWRANLVDREIYLMSPAQFASLDPHDLWHSRLSRVKSRRDVNHAVDEGIATLHGGSWGLSWSEMFAAFQDKIEVREGTDWLDLRKRKVGFEARGHNNPTDFMVNALIVKSIESEKGFAGVWKLLSAKEEDAYFDTLASLTGITKQNYNGRVWALLSAEINELAD